MEWGFPSGFRHQSQMCSWLVVRHTVHFPCNKMMIPNGKHLFQGTAQPLNHQVGSMCIDLAGLAIPSLKTYIESTPRRRRNGWLSRRQRGANFFPGSGGSGEKSLTKSDVPTANRCVDWDHAIRCGLTPRITIEIYRYIWVSYNILKSAIVLDWYIYIYIYILAVLIPQVLYCGLRSLLVDL